MSRNLIFYILVIAIFGSLMWFVFDQGTKLEGLQSPQISAGETHAATSAENPKVETSVHEGAVTLFFRNLSQNLGHPLSLLLIQIIIIVLSSKPARVVETIAVNAPRPRPIESDPHLRELRRNLLDIFASIENKNVEE